MGDSCCSDKSLFSVQCNPTAALCLALQGFVVSAGLLLTDPVWAQQGLPATSALTGSCSTGTGNTARRLTLSGVGGGNATGSAAANSTITGQARNFNARGVLQNLSVRFPLVLNSFGNTIPGVGLVAGVAALPSPAVTGTANIPILGVRTTGITRNAIGSSRLATMNGTANRFSLSGQRVGTVSNLNVRGWRQQFTGGTGGQQIIHLNTCGTASAGGLADLLSLIHI